MAMGTKFGRRLGAVLGLGLLVAACSGSSKTTGNSDPKCEPGARTCDGMNISVCDADGTERMTAETCNTVGPIGGSPSVCTGGVCTTSCVPNTRFCQDGSVWKCDGSGATSKLSQTCATDEFCREADDTATCSDTACTAGAAVCDGDIATKCEADGSGPAAGGTDCAATDQGCYEGQCQDTACVPGMKLCQDGDVYLCAKNGADTSLLADCQAGSVCDGEKVACAPKVCEIGSVGCDGTRAVKCNAYGSAWDPAATDCAADNNVCIAGACKKQTCTPNGTFCQDGNVYQCDQTGVTSTLWQTCTPNYYHCTPYPSSNYAQCDYNQCQPSQLLCDGNTARVCNADGSWPQAGTDCGDKFCESGSCKARVCEPQTIFCKDGDVYGCDWLGSRADLYQQCPNETTCKVTDGSYACIPLPCSPGEVACLANKIGTCAADGQSLSKVTEDCNTSASVCGADNKCTKSSVETLGVAEDATTVYSNYLVGDVVQVSSARKLTEMQLNLVLPAARELRWVVFEETSGSTYTAKQDWVVANQSGSGFFSSGAISFSLKAGKTYLFAVSITGGNSSIAYMDTAPFRNTTTFGTVLGRVDSGYSSVIYAYPDSQFLYNMKLTTGP